MEAREPWYRSAAIEIKEAGIACHCGQGGRNFGGISERDQRSQMSASVGTLRKLARYYKTNILEFHDTTEPNQNLVKPKSRKVLEAGPGVRMELLAWGNTVMEPHLFRVAPNAGSGESYTHVGEEFLYILKGELQIFLRDEEFRLKTGDSFYFESAVPHKWTNLGRVETLILWVNTPPTF